jgi:ABC-2 type transport system ATP-binding protein
VIQLQNVSRWYGQVIGLNDVTCDIGPGVTALLGMNGAGKSTMMRLITGQLRPTTGDIKIDGLEPFANPELYKILGYCPEIDKFYEHNTGRQFVYYLARLAGYSKQEAADRTQQMLVTVGMADRADRPIAGFSKGMRQRIKLAQAMLHDPKIILLDEPLNGLDPIGRHDMTSLLAYLASQGKTILISSHILYEVQHMTESILLLHRGRLLATGDLRVIRSLLDKHPHQVRIDTPDPRGVAECVASLQNVLSMEFDPRGGSLQLEVRDPDSFYNALSELVLTQGLQINGFESPDNNLESVFKYLVEA